MGDITHIAETSRTAFPERFRMAIDQEALDPSRCPIGIATQRMAPRMAPKRQTVHLWSRGEALSIQGLLARPEELESPTF